MKLILQKPIEDNTGKINAHLNTAKVPVFVEFLAEETPLEMIAKLLSRLFTFTAHDSEWVLDEMKSVDLKMVDFAPMRGSFNLALPSEKQEVRSFSNFRNHTDNKSFLYCFTAAYKLFHDPPLQKDTWEQLQSACLQQ